MALKFVTRERIKVDRVACPWLIKRFIDADAELLFVPKDQVLEVAEREGDRDRRRQERARDVGCEHHRPSTAAAIDPDARVEGEQQVRQEVRRRDRAHLARAGVQREHRGQRQRDGRDLVAEIGRAHV